MNNCRNHAVILLEDSFSLQNAWQRDSRYFANEMFYKSTVFLIPNHYERPIETLVEKRSICTTTGKTPTSCSLAPAESRSTCSDSGQSTIALNNLS
ncbi:hypothetical protein PoB_002219100 [Plakobranchus ocellatus]|uniref:Uncharacterized protein n=1 Tax=Plakobranchus ocellatus TaxID=259542 RepID=A0AAV3ZIF7_9GAST|nr:hypothetical protein PoB_002219100 [Plakobranchus ocellatus]